MNQLGYPKSRPEGHYRNQSKYSFNRTYFDDIDTREKSYFLGLLYADGCNHRNSRGLGAISLFLNHRDKYILERFKLEMKSDCPLWLNRGQTGFKIYDKYLSDCLLKKGVFQRKSLILQWPPNQIISEGFLLDFLRGYFDGDGWFHWHKKSVKRGAFAFISTEEFCVNAKNYFESLGIHAGVYKKGKQKVLMIQRNEDLRLLFRLLYNGTDLYLTRKYENFKAFLDD